MTHEPRPAAQAVPDHIDPKLVFDFDFLTDDRLVSDMHDGIAVLAKEAPPLFFTPRNGGHWVAQGRDVIFEIARDFELFSSAAQTEDRKALTVRIPIGMDPPEHTVYRKVLTQAFSPKSMIAISPEIRALAIELIEKVKSEGECDFVASISEPLPVLIFMRMAGLPEERFAEFREWVAVAMGSYDPVERQRVFEKVTDMTAPLVRERMEHPGDDLISRIIQADVGGRPPTFDEVQSFYLMLFMAGLDTVVNAMSFGLYHLAIDQELQTRLREDPSKIPAAMEEILRRYSIALPGRQVARDATWNGIKFRHGDEVMLLIPGAGLDPHAYSDPKKVDLDRGESHIAFGAGAHRCVGANLARIELRILYEEWLSRIPQFQVDPAKKWRFHPALVLSVDSLPLVWQPKVG